MFFTVLQKVKALPRAKIQDIRRQELIDATVASIYKNGFTDLTVSQISKEAGVSAGNIHYYFGGKSELLEATMRWLLNTLRDVSIKSLESATTPRERLDAIVHCNFDPTFFRPETVSAWMHFWAQAPYSETLRRLQVINHTRVRSNLLDALKQIVDPAKAEAAADMIQVLMDGIWLRSAQTPGGLSHEEAGLMAADGVEAALAIYQS